MKVNEDCRDCLSRLVHQTARLATPSTALQAEALRAGLDVVERLFHADQVSPVIATQCYRLIKNITGNNDLYRSMKDTELAAGRRLFQEKNLGYDGDLPQLLKLAALGNTMDFFRDFAQVSGDMEKAVEFAIDHTSLFEDRLAGAGRVLYLADNTGEAYFDLPLLKKLREHTSVAYVVKGLPSQNDVTLEDLEMTGLLEEFGEVLTTGSDAVGIDLDSAGEEFRREFAGCDLVLAKGMGNYETLSELPARGRVFHLLMAKCAPVARSVGVKLGEYAFFLR